jgi:hypothetical protein
VSERQSLTSDRQSRMPHRTCGCVVNSVDNLIHHTTVRVVPVWSRAWLCGKFTSRVVPVWCRAASLVGWVCRLTPDVRLPSGLTSDHFLLKKNGNPPFSLSENRATRSQRRHSIGLLYTTGGIHRKKKHDRHTDVD